MALRNQVGSILKQSISQNPASSLLNYVRCMSSSIFVGGITFEADDKALREAFSAFGQVNTARVIVDRETGKSKGFGFVEFADEKDAQYAAEAMNGQGEEVGGRRLTVNIAEARQTGGRDGGGGGGGGRGGGRY